MTGLSKKIIVLKDTISKKGPLIGIVTVLTKYSPTPLDGIFYVLNTELLDGPSVEIPLRQRMRALRQGFSSRLYLAYDIPSRSDHRDYLSEFSAKISYAKMKKNPELLRNKLLFYKFMREKKLLKYLPEFIPNLKNDWKVLIYWDKIYVLTRYTRKNDFRASGSGNFTFESKFPEDLLDYSYKIFEELDVPQLSIDVCYDGKNFYVIEFQAIYFGTTTLVKSPFYFIRKDDKFEKVEEKSILEQVYAESIVKYIKKHPNNEHYGR